MAKKKIKPKTNSKKVSKPVKKWHAVPLKGSFMATAIFGILISIYYILPQSTNFGVSSIIIFSAMFIAAMISMTKAPVIE